MEYPMSNLYFLSLHMKHMHMYRRVFIPKKYKWQWDIPWYTATEHCPTILYHAIEKTVASTINALHRERVCGIKRNTLACRNLNLEAKTMCSLYTHHQDLEVFLLTLQFSVSIPVFHPAGFVTLAYASCWD